MMYIFYILLSFVIGILIYNLLLVAIRQTEPGSPWRQLGEALYASLTRSYERIHNGTVRIYNEYADKGLNNWLGLLGAVICTIALFMLITIDISFICLLSAQYWGSDKETLLNEISTAAKTYIPIESVTDIFDSLLNWAVSHVTINASGHFLASNALITIICLIVTGLFLKECAKPTGWLPLNLKKFGRWIVGSLNAVLLLCLVFYYGFLIYYGVSSQLAIGAETKAPINYFAETSNDTSLAPEEMANPLSSLDDAKIASSVCYAIAVLGTNFMAFWGMLLLFGMILTFLLVLFRWFLEMGNDNIIIPLGIAMGYIQIQTQPAQINNEVHREETVNELNVEENTQQSVSIASESDNAQSHGKSIDEEHSENQTDLNGSENETEIERRLHEEERQRLISKNPLGV